MEELPTISVNTLTSAPIPNMIRSYSPIIEDPSERDSRPASTDPNENRRLSMTPKPMDNGTPTPSRSVSPALEPSQISGSPSTLPLNDTPDVEVAATKTNLNVDKSTAAQQSPSSSRQATPEPIFRPLITEKGKSKTTGKSIGGWI